MAFSALPTVTDGDLVADTYLNGVKANTDYLLNPNKAIFNSALNVISTSTTFVDADATNLSHTITTYGGPVLIYCCARSVVAAGASPGFVTFTQNGTNLGDANSGMFVVASTDGSNHSFLHIASPTAGANTYRVQIRATSGSVPMVLSTATGNVTFGVIEL